MQGNGAPLGLTLVPWLLTQGCAALHPGLWNLTPLGPTGFARGVARNMRHSTTQRAIRASSAPAPKVRHSTAQGATLGFVEKQNAVALKGRHSLATPRVIDAGEWRPVGADACPLAANPGLRCAPPWAMEYDPFGVGSHTGGVCKAGAAQHQSLREPRRDVRRSVLSFASW
jgi:hypothetical protein